MQQKTNDNKKDWIELGICYRKECSKREKFYQTYLVRNAKRTTKAFFYTIERLGGDTKKTTSYFNTGGDWNFQQFLHHHWKKIANKLGPEEKKQNKKQKRQ